MVSAADDMLQYISQTL
ncbi:hypothetical protein NWE46_23635 [Escherichia coli]|nr:hypothetical protein [Escherichia coli]